MSDNWRTYRSRYTIQEATEHLLQYGALLRIEILDTFGALVYDYYDDYSIGQTEALYRVYHETLERKYNIFNIVPSVLANPDTRPTRICRHIHRHVHTCLKESSQLCTTIRKHDYPHPQTTSTRAVNVTRHVYRSARLGKHYPRGFSLPAVLEYLKAGNLKLTIGLLSGLLHNVQYDSFDDEVRTAERNVMGILMSEMKGANGHEPLMRREQIQRVRTVSELLKQFFESRKKVSDRKKGKSFAVLAEHVVREVEAISRNIELFGSVYDNETIHMSFLFNLVLPPDVVDSDITEAKDYLLKKMEDYDIVGKYLKVEKYQQSGPEQLLMEILGQMRDINFAVDIATALHTHARFWHQSHMVNNLNELLELFDAYENLRKVKKFSTLMSLINEVRNSLWDSKNVSIEILCHNPRACLRLGLETVARCLLVNQETKELLHKLFSHLSQDGSIYADNCKLPAPENETSKVPDTTHSPVILGEDMISEIFTRKRLDATEASTADTTTPKPSERSEPISEKEVSISPSEPTTTAVKPENELPREIQITTEHTTVKSTISFQSESTDQPTTGSTDEEAASTMATAESTTTLNLKRETVSPRLTTKQPTNLMLDTTQESITDKPMIQNSLVREKRIRITQTTMEPTTKKEADTNQPTSSSEELSTEMPTMITRGYLSRESMTTDETTPASRDGCYGDNCSLETPNDNTETSSSSTWNTDATNPPMLSENLKMTEPTDLPTAVIMTTTTTEVPVARVVITDVPETTSESTTTMSMVPGQLKKPKSYSVDSSGEDCSSEDCNSSECSGEECPSLFNPERSISNECSDPDGACSPKSNEDKQDCSNEDCLSTNLSSEQSECTGGQCFVHPTAQSSPECIGDDCPKNSILNSSNSNCVNDDCFEQLKSNESSCSGAECEDNNREQTAQREVMTKTTYSTTVPSWIKCDNKDPHHQRRLHRLQKIRTMNAVHATVPIPTVHPGTNDGDDFSNESNSKTALSTARPFSSLIESKTQKKKLKPLQQDIFSLENVLYGKPPSQQSPVIWFPIPSRSVQKFKDRDLLHLNDESYEEDDSDSKVEPESYKNKNININTNFINLKRYLASRRKTTGETLPPMLQVNPPSRGYRKVVAKVLNHPVPTRWIIDGPRRESNAALEVDVKSTENNSEAQRRRRVNLTQLSPVLYRSEDGVGLLRKNRSIIRAPQKISRRYRAL